MKKVLQLKEGGVRKAMPKGFTLINDGLEKLLKHLPNTLLCHPAQKGHTVEETKFGGKEPAFLVGKNRGKALEVAKAYNSLPIRLSRWQLPANHEIVLFNILLDRMGMTDGDSADRRNTAR